MSRSTRRHHRHRVGAKRRTLMIALGHPHLAERADNVLATNHPFNCDCGSCSQDVKERRAQRAQEKRDWRREL